MELTFEVLFTNHKTALHSFGLKLNGQSLLSLSFITCLLSSQVKCKTHLCVASLRPSVNVNKIAFLPDTYISASGYPRSLTWEILYPLQASVWLPHPYKGNGNWTTICLTRLLGGE